MLKLIILSFALWLNTGLSSTTTIKSIDQIAPVTGSLSIGTSSANANAALDVQSTTKAFMPPRMTDAQMRAISSPTTGMVVYNTGFNALATYNGSIWTYGFANLNLDNTYSAQVSSAGVVSNENKDFITGNCVVTGTSVFTCTLNAFTVAPNCTAMIADSNARVVWSTTQSATQFVVNTALSTTGGLSAQAITISCQKSGVDYLSASSNVYATSSTATLALATDFSAQVSLSGVVSSENLDWVNGNCTNAFPSVCSFNAGIFTVIPNCTATINGGSARVMTTLTIPTTSSISVYWMDSNSGSANSQPFTLRCTRTGVDYTNAVHPFIIGPLSTIGDIAFLSDVKTNTTAGGSSTSTTTHTRVLNTIVDPHSIVTSLTSNQFTLPAGTYYINASAPAYTSNPHKVRIRNITDSTTALVGTSEQDSSSINAQTRSQVEGILTISASKTFELQHYISVGFATSGLGSPTSSGDVEVYATVKIQKLQ